MKTGVGGAKARRPVGGPVTGGKTKNRAGGSKKVAQTMERDGPQRRHQPPRKATPAPPTLSPALSRSLQATAALWLFVLVLWARGALRSGASVVFLMALSAAGVFVAASIAKVARRGDLLGTATRGLLLVLLAAIPVAFDPRTYDVFNVTRYTLTVVSAFALAGLWVAAQARGRERRRWRNGLHWPVLALVAWTAVATAASLSPRVSLLGAYMSYDGLYATVAFAVVFFAVTRAFTLDQVKTALTVLYVAGGGLCVLYGLMQLADRAWGGSWDWVTWGDSASFSAQTSIWSTFGNPNHLAGFLAMLFPVGLVLFLLHSRWWMRILIALIQAALVLELVQTTTRGAWLAAVAALAVLAVMFLPEIVRRPAAALSVCGAVAAVVMVAAFVLGSPATMAQQVSSIIDFEGKGSAAQRFELWRAGVNMASDHPITGVGPEVYSSAFQPYKSAKLVRNFGADVQVNGPHNVFVNYLAGHGYPGLFAFVSVIAFAALRAVAAWRRLRRVESRGRESDRLRAREARLALAAIVGALVAYLVQASFNVQQVGLTFVFWALLGLLCVLALDAGVPVAFRLRALVALPADEDVALAHNDGEMEARPVRQPKQATKRARIPTTPSPRGDPAPPVLAGLGVIALVVFAVPASGPYRAERTFYDASVSHNQGVRLREPNPARAQELGMRARLQIEEAIRLNPWEPSYVAFLAKARAGFAARLRQGSSEQRAALRHAASLYERAVRLDPRNTEILAAYARVLLTIHSVDESARLSGFARSDAISALERAVRANPFDTRLADELRKVRAS